MVPYFKATLVCWIPLAFQSEIPLLVLRIVLGIWFIYLPAFLICVVIGVVGCWNKRERAKPIWLFLPLATLVITPILFIGGLGLMMPATLAGISWNDMTAQNAELEQWPLDKPCPLLWTDPNAAWVWALA